MAFCRAVHAAPFSLTYKQQGTVVMFVLFLLNRCSLLLLNFMF